MLALHYPDSIIDLRRPSDAKKRAKKQLRVHKDILALFENEPQFELTPQSAEPVWLSAPAPAARECLFVASLMGALHEQQAHSKRDLYFANVEALAAHPSGVLVLFDQMAQLTLTDAPERRAQRAAIRAQVLQTLIDNWSTYVALGPRFVFTSGTTTHFLWRGASAIFPMMFQMGIELSASTWWEWLDAEGFKWVMGRALRGVPTTDEDVFAHVGEQPALDPAPFLSSKTTCALP